MAVVAAGELENPVPPRRGAREAHGAHRGFGARRDQPDHLQRRDGVDELLGELDLALGRSAESRSLTRGRDDSLDGIGIGVAEQQRAPRHHPVDIAPALLVLDPSAFAAAYEERLVEADGAHCAHG